MRVTESLITTALRERLIAVFEDPSYRPPPLPSVAMELLTLSNKTDARASDVVRLLEQDEMLAGSVMRLVGSPIYSGRNAIATLKEAVVRLGFKGRAGPGLRGHAAQRRVRRGRVR